MSSLFIFGCYSFDLADQHCEQLARTAIVAVMAVSSHLRRGLVRTEQEVGNGVKPNHAHLVTLMLT